MKKLALTQFITCGLLSLLVSVQVNAHAHNDNHEHNHEHEHAHPPLTEKARQASHGVFADHDVKDRTLSDWHGTWQSVADYLNNGDLDPVIEVKVVNDPSKNFSQYKAYYQQGYATDIQFIGIENNRIDFHTKQTFTSCEYRYNGYKILTYPSGKKGVRYLFTCDEHNTDAPKYIQFSDHIIEPSKAVHFHLYMGNQSHEQLLKEMDNWPTYYPLSFRKDDILHEMLHH